MKPTLKSIFNICLVFAFFCAHAQETTEKKPLPSTKKETAVIPDNSFANAEALPNQVQKDNVAPPKTDRYGLRVGVDLFKLTRGFYDNNYKGIELVGDYRLTKKYFLAAELGTENKTTEDARLDFVTKGSYLKAGFDYNGYENWLDMENIISIGLRYGFSTFSQELENYRIYNTSQYFGESATISSGEKFDGLTASWIEVVAGVKAKVFNNVFLGFSLRLNTLVTNKKPDNFDNLYIPGFNRTYNGSFGVGFNYTVTYFVPIYKKKVVPASIKNTTNSKK
ncbi:DUF6048 family protein [Flavobacterium sp. NG2]|uniref:DUF6048 family protein n=1 Tax=Flavobacterium sp. NG2 TaxID=3097547 RepID=UPI002A7EC225|nr:DUF6048 family protein [Flavobacterium sp. NG2]WPR70944.1 DUF6048 family protein [Flavobacterium sp. NG2]